MMDFSSRSYTGDKRNSLFDMFEGTRDWTFNPANIGIGFFLRGEGNLPGLFSVLNSPRTYGGFGTGTTGFTIDPERELTLTFLSAGLMEDIYHFERMGVLATMVISAMT